MDLTTRTARVIGFFHAHPDRWDIDEGRPGGRAAQHQSGEVNPTTGFDLIFTREDLQAALFVSLLTACLIVALLVFLNRFAQRRYFTIWTVAWVFYALWLLFNFRLLDDRADAIAFVVKQCCVGISAVFLLWGSAVFLRTKARPGVLGLFILFLFVWSCVGAFHRDSPLEFQIPLFSLIGVTSLLASWCYAHNHRETRLLGAAMMAFGFLLWGLYLIAFPFFKAAEQLSAVFLISIVLHLFIAISMIVLVLEEETNAARQSAADLDENLTETQLFKSRARSAEKRFRHIFEQANEAIVVVSPRDFSIIELNQKARDLLGVPEPGGDRIPLSRFLDIGQPDPPPATGADWFRLLLDRRVVDVRHREGRTRQVGIVGSEIQLDQKTAYQFFFRDLTDKSRLEQQLRQAEKLSALGQMISGIAHELNNPLTTIRGYLELILAKHDLTDITRTNLEKVAIESERAAKLVTRFLHFARERKARREMGDLNEIVRRALELHEFEFRVAALDVRLELDDDIPRTLLDPDQAQQVLLNLFTNALHAMIDAPPPHRLSVRTFLEDDWIVVEVEDDGPGVPEDQAARIFEPFYTTKEVGTGTGLGLSIAHSVMVDHNGRIECRNSGSGGAVFTLRFPIVMEGDREDTTILFTPSELEKEPAAKSSAEALILDDEPAIADMLGEMLELLGHRPTLCNAARKAIELIQERDFDVILSDFRMPDLNGEEFRAEAKKIKPHLADRIIFISGDVANEKTQDFLKSTGNRKIDKPFKLEAVRDAIDGLLAADSGS